LGGLLDFLDDPNALSNILGISPSTPAGPMNNMNGPAAAAMSGPVPMPPPRPAQAPQMPPPQAAPGGNGAPMATSDMLAGADPMQGPPGMYLGLSTQTPDFGPNGPPMPPPNPNAPNGNVAGAGAIAAGGDQVPLPTPAPGLAQGLPQAAAFNVNRPPGMEPPIPPAVGGGGLPPAARTAMAPGGSPPGGMAAFPGGPAALVPGATPGGAVPSTTSGGLAAALGLNNPNTVRNMIAAAGKGLSAVGAQRPGANAGQAFAAGAGGSLQGLAQSQQQQFNNTSTAFKDMLAAKAQGNSVAFNTARMNYLNARAQSLTTNGGTGSKAWQNTPLGQVNVIEQRAQAYDSPRRKSIDAAVRSGQMDADAAKAAYADLDTKTEQFKQNMYKAAKIDPAQAEKIKSAGENATNPISTKGMSIDQFHAQVPMGAWYDSGKTDDKGKPIIMQRTVPPPGAQGPNAQAPQQGNPMQTFYDDQEALQPAA
jgi:hypothetical protein